jgi:hypothetical protein
MKMRKHLVNLTIIMLLLLSLIVTPLQQIAFAEESNPNTPEEANEPAAPDASMPPPILEFNGLDREDFDAGGTDPETVIPDTTGAAGHTHFMQAVNKAIAIFTKGGTLIDSADFNTFWSPATTGTACDGGNGFHHGQPYLMYDHLAGRWIVTDVAYDPALVADGPYYMCIAVSNSLMAPMTPGAYFNGTYWYYYAVRVYEFNEDFYPDSPKMGLWPDGYYLAIDLYEVDQNGLLNSPRGVKVYAFNRSDLTNGVAGFRSVDFYLTESKGYEHLVPSNLLGTPPASGTPNYFAAIQQGALHVWEFNTDWSNPNYSTFGVTRDSIPNEPNFTLNTGYNDWPIGPIIPQQDVVQRVPVLGDRLMSPLQYRLLGGIPSLWATHTVEVVPGRIGLRWYEMQFFDSNNLDFVQQGTYAPDTDTHARWLGSLATDRTGNMALGFSISSASMYPAIKYVGRLRTDPFDTLPQTETFFNMNGTALPYYVGSQDDGDASAIDGEWGRQSQMSIDPMDECVFWYTNMYYDETGMMWRTRIGWFSFPACSGGETTRISLSTEGWEGNYDSGLDRDIYEMYQVAVSATGRYVAFSSEATTLVSGDTNGHRDVFLRDRDTDNDGDFDEPGNVLTTRISMAPGGVQANNDSWEVSISFDGRYIAYSSDADNLVADDGNGARDVFLYDRVLNQTRRVSVQNGTVNTSGNNASDHPGISGDGRFVAFRSAASDLITGDTNNVRDIFVRQMSNNTTTRVSIDSAAVQADGPSFNPTMSETGQFVAFASEATNLVAGDGNGFRDVFVHDRSTGATTRVSVATSAAEANDQSYTPFISGNGNFVVFASEATNLDEVTTDTNGFADIFVHDRALASTTRVSLSFFGAESDGNSYTPSISREGRYITFASEATNLDVTQSNSNGVRNIYLHDRQLALNGIYAFGLTSRISLDTNGGMPNDWSFAPMVAAYGRHVAYVSEATDLVQNDLNLHWDVFAYDSQRTIPIFLSIPSSIPGSTGALVTVPVIFSGNNSNIDTTNFSIDFDENCLSFDGSNPNAIQFMLNSSSFYTGATYNANETASEIDVSIYSFTNPRQAIPDGTIMTIEFRVKATCAAPPGSSRSARVGFSTDPIPSFANSGVSISGWALDGFVRILPGLLGDCNGDNRVDAGDLSALVLEIFDGDGMLPADTPNVNPITHVFAGNAVGCNPNQDYVVDAGDISCTVNIIFGNTGCTGASAAAGELMYIQLSEPQE